MAKIKISDYQLANALSGLSGLDARQRPVVEYALQVHSRDKGGYEELAVNEMLAHLEKAGLISGETRKSIIKHLFTQ
ncbi:hypothetical protein CO057_03945 [Candidatus Uhrbacteria bacterium CG_4_9_14_0_2_um_filter_41_50]|uniref:Uncharacterized protein n=1 Tax=Candidatus Uhrbacteria bacterium CG_4_9_14_0_2_um_filter_41_50 TaxID=1975031 RepID=A0A2M8ENL8_9BACT|nr:MAG: hypothetical protein COZ45_01875 [Candidatus Uhrbacteria bacterium CG_4_10_14_3_um_filter_41_21]PIZ55379.1 MAG: hypothetical protein COY24_00630 [Candidatus Uhrbacteria bacterium CG_4_10_14_0_2_um_filter_41_21]PJB84301.1 MAG: hypothetical protein CO086_04395 [Candidatus Uhrbacteria bacterium CG_4_9_14_0_8_um_filter_41_16]PJC24247.1 MAG: hypothetical protein CO057_03945 [Candidatus Uhrbacteria bacterium CG_4_9_14_0_2_um_filter_41_50]PJE74851.1 MAG: hypothetical protein COV03_03155 [Candi